MINVTNKFKEEVQNGSRYFVCYAAITLKDGTVLELDNSKIWDGGFKYEEATSGSGSFDIGSAVIGKCTLLVNNITDEYSQYDFAGANANLRIGLQFGDGTEEVVQKGVYTVDEPDYNGTMISLSCLDNLSKFEKPYSDIKTVYPATLGVIVRDICFERGIVLDTPEFSNHEYVVQERPEDKDLTDLAVLSYVAQIAGCYVKCSPTGGVGLYWYSEMPAVDDGVEIIDAGTFGNEPTEAYDGGAFGNEPTEVVDGGDFSNIAVAMASEEEQAHIIRSISSIKVCTDDVVITGITVEGEEQSATFGSEGYVLKISRNPFILSGQEKTVADFLGAKIVGMSFRPLTVSALSDPSIEAGDSAVVVDAKGNRYATYLTSISFSVGNYENFVCDAKTPSRNSATQYKASTESVVTARKEAEKVVSKYDKYVEQMSNLISQGSGMFKTDVTQADGTIVTYIHDKPNMEESAYVAYWTSNGIMASKDGGATFAIDANGNALLNTLMLKGLSADWIKVGTLEGVKAILESGLIGGWNITKGAIYKDVAMPNDENTVYRVYFQPPGGSAPDKTWILSCQKSTDGGKTFYGQFILYADGSASYANGKTKIGTDGSISVRLDDGNSMKLSGTGLRFLSTAGDALGSISVIDGKSYLRMTGAVHGPLNGYQGYTGDVSYIAQGNTPGRLSVVNGIIVDNYV